MDICAKCNRAIYMSHPLDHCYHCDEPICPDRQGNVAVMVLCETSLKGNMAQDK